MPLRRAARIFKVILRCSHSGVARVLRTASTMAHEEKQTRRGSYASLIAAGCVLASAHLQDTKCDTEAPSMPPADVNDRASKAFSILMARSHQAPSLGKDMEDKLTIDRWLSALHNLGFTHYSSIEMHRIWKHLEEVVFSGRGAIDCSKVGESKHKIQGISRREFCSLAKQSPLLEAALDSLIYREESLTFKLPDTFDLSKSTADNYAVKSMDVSHSEFAKFRKGGEPPEFRDYSYHSNYSRERQTWQDLIVKMTAHRHNPQSRPWIVFSCGAMGCGKGYAFEYMSGNGYFPLEQIVRIDPDLIKELMPEWQAYVQGGYDAGTMTHKESGFIQELCQEAALHRRQNIWIDGSLRDAEWFAKVFDDIRKRFPHYRIGIFHVFASEAKVRERIDKRFRQTGRGVPEFLIQKTLQAPPLTLYTLSSRCDWIVKVENEVVPRLVNFSSNDNTGSWKQLTVNFSDFAAAPHEFPRALAPINFRVVEPEEILDAHIGPLTVIGTSNTATGLRARQHMCIPEAASSFAWAKRISPEIPRGGFVFYDDKKNVVGGLGVMSQVAGDADIDKMPAFEFQVRKEVYNLPESLKDPDRWCAITLPDLLIRGATHYAYVLPQELDIGGLGAFMYKTKADSDCACAEYLLFKIRVPSTL